MPNKPLRPCAKPGCRNLTRSGYCAEHAHLQARQEPEQRLSAHQRGYTYRYNKARRTFLTAHPWCVECAKQGNREPATELDHIIPHKGDMVLFWDTSNWQRQERLERTVDDIRRRFGHYAVARAIIKLDPTLGQFDAKGDHIIHPIGYFA